MRHGDVNVNDLTPEQALDCLEDAWHELGEDYDIPDEMNDITWAIIDLLRANGRKVWSDE